MVENVEDVINGSEILPLLQDEAKSLGLNVYVFSYEDVEEFYKLKSDRLGIALLAKDEDNARHNLMNLRKCYLIKYKE